MRKRLRSDMRVAKRHVTMENVKRVALRQFSKELLHSCTRLPSSIIDVLIDTEIPFTFLYPFTSLIRSSPQLTFSYRTQFWEYIKATRFFCFKCVNCTCFNNWGTFCFNGSINSYKSVV